MYLNVFDLRSQVNLFDTTFTYNCNGLVCDSYCRIDDLDGKGLTTCLTGSGLDAELFIYQ